MFFWFYCDLCLYISGSSCCLVFIWKPACHRWELSNTLLSAVLTHFPSCTTDFSYFSHPRKRLLFTHRKYNSSIWSKLYFKSLLFLFQKFCITILSLNKVYGSMNFKLLLLVPILSVSRDVGPFPTFALNAILSASEGLCSVRMHGICKKVRISLSFFYWKRRSKALLWQGWVFPRAPPFPVTKWWFRIAASSRDAEDPRWGWVTESQRITEC